MTAFRKSIKLKNVVVFIGALVILQSCSQPFKINAVTRENAIELEFYRYRWSFIKTKIPICLSEIGIVDTAGKPLIWYIKSKNKCMKTFGVLFGSLPRGFKLISGSKVISPGHYNLYAVDDYGYQGHGQLDIASRYFPLKMP